MADVLTRPPDAPVTGPPAGESARRSRWSPSAGQIIAVPAVLLALTAVVRYLFGHGTIDLVVFDQGIWAFSRTGEPWVSVIRENLLGDHFGPGILAFGLLYRIVATPIWLLVGQAVAAWFAVRMIAARLVPAVGEVKAGLVGAALLLSPPVAYALLFDVHGVTFAVPLALAAVFALERGRPLPAFGFALLAAAFRVDVGLAVLVAFAVWPGSRRGRLLPGLGLLAYMAAATHFEASLGQDNYWAIHYGHLGIGPKDAVLHHPFGVVSFLFSGQALFKVLPWLATGAFMALRRPRLVVPAVVLALPIVLSDWEGTSGIVFHYGYAPTLFLALAWLPVVLARPDRFRHVVGGCLILGLLFGPVAPSLTSSSFVPYAARFWKPSTQKRCIIAGIPAGAGVSAGGPLSLVAHRSELYLWPYPFRGPDPDVLPSERLASGDPALAAKVDYLIIPMKEESLVPAGFTLEGRSDHYLRYRRAATTSASKFRTCR